MLASGRHARLALAVLATALLAVVLIAAAGVLAALPALLAFLPLLAGRYLGAERLERLIDARRPERRPSATMPAPVRTARVATARGARLLAFSLAKRPPPASAVFA